MFRVIIDLCFILSIILENCGIIDDFHKITLKFKKPVSKYQHKKKYIYNNIDKYLIEYYLYLTSQPSLPPSQNTTPFTPNPKKIHYTSRQPPSRCSSSPIRQRRRCCPARCTLAQAWGWRWQRRRTPARVGRASDTPLWRCRWRAVRASRAPRTWRPRRWFAVARMQV